jgi:hypothetical protein
MIFLASSKSRKREESIDRKSRCSPRWLTGKPVCLLSAVPVLRTALPRRAQGRVSLNCRQGARLVDCQTSYSLLAPMMIANRYFGVVTQAEDHAKQFCCQSHGLEISSLSRHLKTAQP